MDNPVYVVMVTTEIVDRETKKALHEENAVVVFARPREYLSGNSFTEYTDEEEIAYYVKKQMIAQLHSRDSMASDSKVRPLREKIKGHNYYVDALCIRTDEYLSVQWLKNIPSDRWMPEYRGPLFNGIVNPFTD